MAGRDRLRRYLQQRREAGERDLLLDSLTVEEVMRILGASGSDPEPGGGDALDAVGLDIPDVTTTSDWRAVLTAADRAVPLPRIAEPLPAPPPAPRSKPGGQAKPPTAPIAQSHRSAESPSPAPILERGQPGPASPARWPSGIEIGRAANELFAGPLASLSDLGELERAIASCTKCPLYATATRPVPGEGSPTARLVCVGEAPGATEDATGRPFVGQAGKLLDKILAAIALAREDVFICNVLKHRPPGNRNPLPVEVTACSPYLVRQLELIRPRVIVAFGTFAAQTLLQASQPIGKLRGAVHRYYGVPLIVTYHPAALLRNPAWKRPTWEDVQYARRILDGSGV